MGGFVASLMPLQQHRPEMSLGLYALILVPAALVASRHRWTEGAIAIWAAGTLVLLPISQDRMATWQMGVAAIEATGIAGLATYAWASRRGEGLVPSPVAALAVLVTGLVAFAIRHGLEGAEHIAIYSALALATAFVSSSPVTRGALLTGAAGTALTTVPFGFAPTQIPFILLALAALCVAGTFRFDRLSCLALAAVEIALAGVQYVVLATDRGLDLSLEFAFLGLGLAVAAVAGRRGRPLHPDAETGFLTLGLIALARLGHLATVQFGWLEPNFAITAGCLLASLSALAWGFWRELPTLRQISFCGLALTSLKALSFDLATAAPFVRVGLLFALGIGLLGGGYWYIRRAAKATPAQE
jgi:hypothetical protein